MGNEELRFVRDDIESLQALRLQSPLGTEAQKLYESLCRRERALLVSLGRFGAGVLVS